MPKTIDPRIKATIERNAGKRLGDKLWSAAEMRRRLEAEVGAGRLKGELPSIRAIHDILAKARSQPMEARRQLGEVRWPEAFGDDFGLMPWSAQPAYFELLYRLGGQLPLLPLAQWFWRLSLAAPDAKTSVRHYMAAAMALAESGYFEEVFPSPDAVEVYLAFAPWRSVTAMHDYRDRVSDEFLMFPPELVDRPDVPEELRFYPTTVSCRMKAWGHEGLAHDLASGVTSLESRNKHLALLDSPGIAPTDAPSIASPDEGASFPSKYWVSILPRSGEYSPLGEAMMEYGLPGIKAPY